MTEAEYQEQLKIAQDTVNALTSLRDEDLARKANQLANAIAQIAALQRTIAAKDAVIAERDATIKDLTTPQDTPKLNGSQPHAEAAMAPA